MRVCAALLPAAHQIGDILLHNERINCSAAPWDSLGKPAWCQLPAGEQLREQVATLQEEYGRATDALESNQGSTSEVRPAPTPAPGTGSRL